MNSIIEVMIVNAKRLNKKMTLKQETQFENNNLIISGTPA